MYLGTISICNSEVVTQETAECIVRSRIHEFCQIWLRRQNLSFFLFHERERQNILTRLVLILRSRNSF